MTSSTERVAVCSTPTGMLGIQGAIAGARGNRYITATYSRPYAWLTLKRVILAKKGGAIAMTDRPKYPGLPVGAGQVSSAHSQRICIATYEIVGPSRNGGIGTAYFSLANALAEAGHQVTVLYLLRRYSEEGSVEKWREFYSSRGIEFVPLPWRPSPTEASQEIVTAHNAYKWLRLRQFDVIHFPELMGHGYYCVLAKHQGLDFQDTIICIGAHSPISWINAINREFTAHPDQLEVDFMEHESVRLADVVVSPSQYLLNWLTEHGWKLPNRCYVQQYLLSPELRSYWLSGDSQAAAPKRADELVFFGRLEERKGIILFCDALERLPRGTLSHVQVTFLGKSGKVADRDATSYIKDRAKTWSFDWRMLTSFDHREAMDYLRQGNRLAIIPSLEDNLPNAVLECLCARIPFLASRSGGIPELISAPDLDKNTFTPSVPALAECLQAALANGISIAHPAVDPELNRSQWIRWHENLAPADFRKTDNSRAVSPNGKPLVSVCLATDDDPKRLRLSVAALNAQDWQAFEVILVAYGSLSKAQPELDRLNNEFDLKHWKVIRLDKDDPAAARDLAAQHAVGEHMLFMDSGCYAEPDLIRLYLDVATRTGADALTCFLGIFSGGDDPAHALNLGPRPFLGPATLPGIFRNQFGDANVFVRRSAYDALGGFARQKERGCGYWGFLARLVLSGYRLEVVPRALAAMRARDDALLPGAIEYDDAVSALEPYAEELPEQLRDLATVMLGLRVRLQQGAGNRPSSPHGGRDPSRLVYELGMSGERHLAAMLNEWLEFRSARANLPVGRRQRLGVVLKMLARRHYHRFGHGFGSAFRDLSKSRCNGNGRNGDKSQPGSDTFAMPTANGANGSITHPPGRDAKDLRPSPR